MLSVHSHKHHATSQPVYPQNYTILIYPPAPCVVISRPTDRQGGGVLCLTSQCVSVHIHHTSSTYKSCSRPGGPASTIRHISLTPSPPPIFFASFISLTSASCLVPFSMSQDDGAGERGERENRRHKKDTAGPSTGGGGWMKCLVW